MKKRSKKLLLFWCHAGATRCKQSKVFCFFFSKKKTLSSLRRQMNTAFRISDACIGMKHRAGQILSAVFICHHAAPGRNPPRRACADRAEWRRTIKPLAAGRAALAAGRMVTWTTSWPRLGVTTGREAASRLEAARNVAKGRIPGVTSHRISGPANT